ncbi:hypothetical protein FRC11_003717, partial [Ceratobasidium sp. 423]
MPSDSMKCQCTRSSCKGKGCNNEGALKCECNDKKKGTKAHKAHCEEGKVDDLLVEHEGEPAELMELH